MIFFLIINYFFCFNYNNIRKICFNVTLKQLISTIFLTKGVFFLIKVTFLGFFFKKNAIKVHVAFVVVSFFDVLSITVNINMEILV